MSTGVEIIETAIKFARKWGYTVKNIPKNKAKILFCDENFHGRTISIISASNDPARKDYFGPSENAFIRVPFNDVQAVE